MSLQVCARCVYDAATPGISYDATGVCNYCHMHDDLERQYPTGAAGARILERMADDMRRAGRGREYDCVVGVSGGCDSSFMLAKMVELGVRPLAVHFDNTWNSPIATQNIYNVLEKLGVELYTLVVNNKEYDDLYRAFMVSGIKDIEAPTDIGLTSTLYMAAEKHRVRYIVEGHSFRTEGISPLGWIYMDGKLIESVHARHGTRPMKTFPNLTLYRFLRWAAWRGIKRVRPLYWIDYDKADAKRFLSRDLGWTWYGGHHLENRFTAFFHTYWLPTRYGIDARLLGHAALVRSGQMARDDALAELAVPHPADPEIIGLVKKRLGFSDEEFEAVMRAPTRHYSEFATYKRTFERLRPFFWLLWKLDRVPQSFYMKFTRPDPSTPARRAAGEPEPAVHARPGLHQAD